MSYSNTPTIPAIIAAKQEVAAESLSAPQYYADQHQSYDSGATLSDYLRILRKHSKSITFIFLSALALTFFINHALVPVYRAEASMKIDIEPVQVLDYGINSKYQQQRGLDPVYLQTQYKLLRSRKLAKRVISELNLEKKHLEVNTFKPFIHNFLSPVSQAKSYVLEAIGIKKPTKIVSLTKEQIFLKHLTIKPVKNTQIVEVLYKSEDPELSADIVNQFIETFTSYNIETRREAERNAELFLRTELLNARQKLQDSEASLLGYAKQQNIVNTGSDRSILEKNLEELSSAYIKAKEQRIIAESIYSKKHNVAGAVHASNSELIGKLKSKLTELKSQYQEKSKTYKPNYPAMLALKKQIAVLNSQVQRETSLVTSSINKDLRATFLSAQQQERNLNKEIRTYEKRLLSFEDKNLNYMNLQREADTNRVLYEGLLQRLKEVGIASGAGDKSIEVIDSALAPVKSNSPKKGLNLMMGAVLGLFLAMLVAFLRHLTNNKITSVEDLERLNLPYPVLTTLPKVSRSQEKNLALFAVNKPHSSLAESIRYLHTNLAYAEGVPKLLHITSALPSEGKSSIVTNLATMLAKSGKKVLIIDGDLRRPTMHTHLKIDNKVGLSSYLANKATAIPIQKASSKYPLFVIPAGPSVEDPVSLLSNQRMIQLCEKARDAFDHIILDSPPVLGLADSLVLSNRADATVFVISSNKPNEKEILSAIDNMKKGFANIIGLVFTKEKNNTTQYYSSFDYSDGRQALT